MRLPHIKTLVWTLLATVLTLPSTLSVQAKAMEHPFARREKVPQLPQNLTWLNTAGPLELHDLRGKFVLVDFWTYCCINCMHILPELHKLEQAWPKNLVVIGVHSAKFSTEQDTRNVRAAIQRYKIEHPVINDARHELWELFQVNAWPTVILIDPEGYAVWGTSGEITAEQVDRVIRAGMPYYREKKLLDEAPLRFDVELHAAAATPLRFPGKILADEATGRLFISDSNHNRIVVAKLDGTLLDVIGSGVAGRKDGDFTSAQFNQPQGMALYVDRTRRVRNDGTRRVPATSGDVLFVADTENHEIRRVDLAARKVTTIAGTGQQGRGPTDHGYMVPAGRRADPRRTALSSPWDLCLHGNDLFIAMAGCHQIWKMRIDGSTIGPYAGNGREDIVDGPLLPSQSYQPGFASFAQPSGLASDGTWLYVADSEGSSIRAVPLNPRAEVRTVVGTSRLPVARLFTFGDVDGPAAQARFQHPLGVAFHAGRIYVADTYNHKIRVVDPADGSTRTLAGAGGLKSTLPAGGLKSTLPEPDRSAAFFEPAGLAVAAGKLFVADTNNHRIRAIDLQTSQVSTLAITGLKPPAPPPTAAIRPAESVEKVSPAVIRAEHGEVRLRVELEFPEGYKINTSAPLEYRLDDAGQPQGSGAGVILREGFGKPVRIEKPAAEFEIRLPVNGQSGRDVVQLAVDYYYCREGAEGLCKVGSATWIVPVELSASAEIAVLRLRHRAK
jgi:thiol-disulfide isomerase/thioredoxin/sugar lactone lactonase YvrE